VRDEGPLEPERAVDLILQVLKAARFAHRRGIIHRDFKPHNVLVDDDDRVKVTDFGIARAGASEMTETGSIMGTAQYLSPEQAHGNAVSARSDLYSIGIMLYELLTGRVPFDGDSPVTVALKQVSELPVMPRALNPQIPPALEDVVLKSLEKDPDHRFADADAFIAALRAAVGVDPRLPATGAYPVAAVLAEDPVEQLEREDRRTLRMIALVFFLVLALAGLAYGAYLLTRPEQVRIPDVVGDRSEIATARLQNAGFRVDLQRARSATAPEDRVYRQSPTPGTEADEGSTVTLTVSDGPGDSTVPPVEGELERTARRQVERAGFKVRVRQEASATVPAGRVIESRPSERTQLQRGRTVQLVVSSGPRQVRVPGVVGRTRENAESTLRAAGFEVRVAEQVTDDAAPGTVLKQNPGAGASADEGATISLSVAKQPTEVVVPDVEGQTRRAATAALEEAGLTARARERAVETPDEDDTVVEQNPPAGERRKRGATVFITIGTFEVPNPDATPTPTPTAESP
jgi:serine/threonine-protein kinase